MYWMGDATIPDPLHTPLPSPFPLGRSWPLRIQQAGQIQAHIELGVYLPLMPGSHSSGAGGLPSWPVVWHCFPLGQWVP